ncbi:alpha-ketoglutarate-dependent dioxygenase AlkB [uncultured Rothia sp.]|uniref:alpha-ketoglutarate-dependent dioxygenase AlkB family protein n=1 Tax=uncultured Rothia sp. TaxID=316088 RepID=UPI0032175075
MPALFSDADLVRQPREIYPGCVHVPGWLSMNQQRFLVGEFFRWGQTTPEREGISRGIPPHSPEIYGKKMSVRLTSLGWHWSDYAYRNDAPEFGGAQPFAVPDWLQRMGRQALDAAYQPSTAPSWPAFDGPQHAEWVSSYCPDVALINYYAPHASMGMHQDKDERSSMPIVSVSLGNTGVFRAGNSENKNMPFEDVLLASGDLIVFGGPSRFMYHGVPKILPDTSPAELNFPEGRINITLRQTGLSPAGN